MSKYNILFFESIIFLIISFNSVTKVQCEIKSNITEYKPKKITNPLYFEAANYHNIIHCLNDDIILEILLKIECILKNYV